MNCSKCNLRSAVGYCGVTHELLCEECGTNCDECGMLVDSAQIIERKSGVHLCPACNEKRDAKRVERHKRRHKGHTGKDVAAVAASTSLSNLEEEPAQPDLSDDTGAEEDEALTQSGYLNWQPWQLSVMAGLTGVVGAVLITLVPYLRGISLPNGAYIPMAYIIVFLPIISFVWAFAGLTYAKYWGDREKCLAGAGMGALAVVLLFTSWFTDPVRDAKESTEIAIRTRDDMGIQELGEWRENILNRYR